MARLRGEIVSSLTHVRPLHSLALRTAPESAYNLLSFVANSSRTTLSHREGRGELSEWAMCSLGRGTWVSGCWGGNPARAAHLDDDEDLPRASPRRLLKIALALKKFQALIDDTIATS